MCLDFAFYYSLQSTVFTVPFYLFLSCFFLFFFIGFSYFPFLKEKYCVYPMMRS